MTVVTFGKEGTRVPGREGYLLMPDGNWVYDTVDDFLHEWAGLRPDVMDKSNIPENFTVAPARMMSEFLRKSLVAVVPLVDKSATEIDFRRGDQVDVMLFCMHKTEGLMVARGSIRESMARLSTDQIQEQVRRQYSTDELMHGNEFEIIHAMQTGEWRILHEIETISFPLKHIPVSGLQNPPVPSAFVSPWSES